MLMVEREMDNLLPGDTTAEQNATEGIRRKSYFEVVIEGVRWRARVFVGDSIVRKTDRALNKEEDVVVCIPEAKIEASTERVKTTVSPGKGGSILVHVGTNNAERDDTTATLRKYRQLVKRAKHTNNYVRDSTGNGKQRTGISKLPEDGN